MKIRSHLRRHCSTSLVAGDCTGAIGPRGSRHRGAPGKVLRTCRAELMKLAAEACGLPVPQVRGVGGGRKVWDV